METPEDGGYAFSGEQIDLGLMLEDNLVLSLPSRHLCGQTCAGLCPKCGKDLNEGPCGCEDDDRREQSFLSIIETEPGRGGVG